MSNTKPIALNQKQFIRIFKDTLIDDSGLRFCFLLGAGASRSSEVKTKKDLVLKWLKEIAEDLQEQQLEEWIVKTGVTENTVEQHYAEVIKKRFPCDPTVGDKIMQQQAAEATPSIGYLILAQILEKTRHNLALTCNADYLVEDALFLVSTKSPMPYEQSSDVEKSIPQTVRPMVLRMRCNQEESYENQHCIDQALNTYKSILIGHSGNNSALINYLSHDTSKHRQPIFWCTRDSGKIPQQVMQILTCEDYIVEIEGFDSLMYHIINAFNHTRYSGSISLRYFDENHCLDSAKQKARLFAKLLSGYHIPVAVVDELNDSPQPIDPPQVIDDMDQLNDFMSSIEQSSNDEPEECLKKALEGDPKRSRQ